MFQESTRQPTALGQVIVPTALSETHRGTSQPQDKPTKEDYIGPTPTTASSPDEDEESYTRKVTLVHGHMFHESEGICISRFLILIFTNMNVVYI